MILKEQKATSYDFVVRLEVTKLRQYRNDEEESDLYIIYIDNKFIYATYNNPGKAKDVFERLVQL